MKKAYLIRLSIAMLIGIIIIAGFLGFYPVKILDLQIVPLINRILSDYSIIALSLLVFVLLLTLIFGRFYCSLICPLGLMQEFFSIIFKKKNQKQKNFSYKYFILAITFGFLIGGSCLLIRYIDPYSVFGSFISLSIYGIIFGFIILGLVFFKNRFFCSNICPVGALLGLISKFSLVKININKKTCVNCSLCEKNCPTGSIDCKKGLVEQETCVKCLKCASSCPKGAIEFGSIKKEEEFNPKRREFLTLVGSLVLFSSAFIIARNYTQKTIKKLKNIILPAGAQGYQRFKDKCLNCNLCVNVCPNKIIKKADKSCETIHIDYKEGKGFCKFDCRKCQEVCPSGAIKKTTLEKNKTQELRLGLLMTIVLIAEFVLTIALKTQFLKLMIK